MEIGTIQEVSTGTDQQDGYILVRRGLIFSRDTYVPLDTVVRRVGTDVFINVPKLVVGEMPWEAPPDRATQKNKYGPPAGQVQKLYGSRNPTLLHGSPREPQDE